jgi:hypothetical protein
MLADLLQPSLVSRSIAGRLGVNDRRGLSQGRDASFLDLCGLALLEAGLQPIARRASLCSTEIVDQCFDKGVRAGVRFCLCHNRASSKAFFQKTPQAHSAPRQ